MIKVENEIKICEINGDDSFDTTNGVTIKILSHWNDNNRVTIQLWPGGATYTVIARDLQSAIANATNINRF